MNIGATSVGGMINNVKAYASVLMPGVVHMRHTHLDEHKFISGQPETGAEIANDLERICTNFGSENIAACIVEPIAGSTGTLVPPVGYLQRLRELCDKHKILLIFDEVITGWGRTGSAFGAQEFGVTPDIMTMAKATTNGIVPFGVVACKEEIYDAVMDNSPKGAIELFHGYTYSGIPVALAAALAVQDIFEKEDIFNRAKDLAPYFQKGLFSLQDLDHIKFDKGFHLESLALRSSEWMQQDIFKNYQSETELMRYIFRLAEKDFSLVDGMMPLGSCTMKLNSAAELNPVSWANLSSMHPFSPPDQTKGYSKIISDLEKWISEIIGLKSVSFQPNAGSQGEFAGLLAINSYFESKGELLRKKCLIPKSAHGTNPASAVMAGFDVLTVECDDEGNIDFQDLSIKVKKFDNQIGALMLTYPSTHGVFELQIRKICDLIHSVGGFVYLDGANLNAQVGLCKPGNYGVDVCHLNLHKTFCIPHGGGGPGVGPVAASETLSPYLPTHSLMDNNLSNSFNFVSSAKHGSASILPISWMYIKMAGLSGLRKATSHAILSANYIAHSLKHKFKILYKGNNNFVAHECILDFRDLKSKTGLSVNDLAKRLIDYSFHAPTISWPVPETIMIEPTESESLVELDRFCEAMLLIGEEISEIEKNSELKNNNVISNAPHTLKELIADNWQYPYSKEKASFPYKTPTTIKFWSSVSRINNAYGDRNLICSCNVNQGETLEEKKCA